MNTSKSLWIRIAGLGVLSIALTLCLIMIVSANGKKKIPEPKNRPDIREDAVWDEELGMYISGDLVKDENGEYILKPDAQDDEPMIDFEEEWRMKHVSSEDPIDQAILLSLKLSQENPDNPLLSARTPQRSEAILTAMRTIPIEVYPDVWERCCTEVAYRAQKLAGMEQFLNISLEYGLYDPWAQEQWYLRFTEMKASLPAGEVTKEDALRYGNLLLPLLEERLKSGNLGSGEWTVLQTMIPEASEQFDFPEKTVSSRKEALDWFAAYENLTNAIRQIIANDYDWTPRSGN